MTAFTLTKSNIDQRTTSGIIPNAEALCILKAYRDRSHDFRVFRTSEVPDRVDDLIAFIETNRTDDDPPVSEILATTGIAALIFDSSRTMRAER